MKKRKLNSKNPKYHKAKVIDENIIKTFVQKVKGVKIYTLKTKKS